MKPVYQTRFGSNPDAPGNCFAACIASIFECSIVDLPSEVEIVEKIKKDNENWNRWTDRYKNGRSWELWWLALQSWLEQRNLFAIDIHKPPPELESDTYLVLTAKSPRGAFYHSVVSVGFSNEIIHDPHPDNTGLIFEDDAFPSLYTIFAVLDPGKK
jgi:hypothetical protein